MGKCAVLYILATALQLRVTGTVHTAFASNDANLGFSPCVTGIDSYCSQLAFWARCV